MALFGALLFPGMMLGLFWLFRLARALALGIGWPEVKRWWPAPALVAVTLLLIMVDAPFRLRFELARGSFDELAAEFEAGDLSADNGDFDVLTTVGSFTISRAYPVDEGFILYEQHGNFFDNAGFAYLPEGPDDSLANGGFEAPSFPSLGGDWYAWTASW